MFSSYEPVQDRGTDRQTDGQDAKCGLQDVYSLIRKGTAQLNKQWTVDRQTTANKTKFYLHLKIFVPLHVSVGSLEH